MADNIMIVCEWSIDYATKVEMIQQGETYITPSGTEKADEPKLIFEDNDGVLCIMPLKNVVYMTLFGTGIQLSVSKQTEP